MMRSTPAPVFNSSASVADNTYQSLYFNGLSLSGLWFFKPVDKFKVGLGFDYVHFFNNKLLKESNYGAYASDHMTSAGIRTELVYSKDSRTDFALTVSAANTQMKKIQIDNISVAATVYYKLCGKEIKIKKEIYKLDYSKM